MLHLILFAASRLLRADAFMTFINGVQRVGLIGLQKPVFDTLRVYEGTPVRITFLKFKALPVIEFTIMALTGKTSGPIIRNPKALKSGSLVGVAVRGYDAEVRLLIRRVVKKNFHIIDLSFEMTSLLQYPLLCLATGLDYCGFI